MLAFIELLISLIENLVRIFNLNKACTWLLGQFGDMTFHNVYPEDASERTVKIPPVHKIVVRVLCDSLQPCEQIGTFPSTHICLLLNCSSLHTYMKKHLSPYADLKFHAFHFPHNTSHITLGNEQCLKLLLRV